MLVLVFFLYFSVCLSVCLSIQCYANSRRGEYGRFTHQFLFLLCRLQSCVKSFIILCVTNWSRRTRMMTEMWSKASEITVSSDLLVKRDKLWKAQPECSQQTNINVITTQLWKWGWVIRFIHISCVQHCIVSVCSLHVLDGPWSSNLGIYSTCILLPSYDNSCQKQDETTILIQFDHQCLCPISWEAHQTLWSIWGWFLGHCLCLCGSRNTTTVQLTHARV